MTGARNLPYTYVVLRYVHDPVSGERLNVGVLLHCPAQAFARLAVRGEAGRLAVAFPGLDGEALTDVLRSLARSVEALRSARTPEGDAGRLARLAMPDDDASLRWSRTGGGLTGDPERELDRLFRRMVSRHDEPAGSVASERGSSTAFTIP